MPGTKPINGMYPACKFALTALTECLRQEVAYIEMGIKVSVMPIRYVFHIKIVILIYLRKKPFIQPFPETVCFEVIN